MSCVRKNGRRIASDQPMKILSRDHVTRYASFSLPKIQPALMVVVGFLITWRFDTHVTKLKND
jgi:hypothetical protein